MKEKIANGYKKYKELKQIPRYNALIKLGLYFVFFLVFGLIFALNTTPKQRKQETQVNEKKYSFIYKINDNIITGKKDKNITFIYNDINYNITDNELICDLEECNIDYMYIFELFDLDKINNYIKNGELISKTEYVDQTMEYKYKINDEKVKEYFNSELSFEIMKKDNIYTINLENYNIFDKITLEYK